MAEDFQGGVCGGNWPWNSSRNLFASSPCSLAITNDIGAFAWPSHELVTDIKAARSSDDSVGSGSASDGGGSVVIQNSNFQMMASSAPPDDWNHDLLHDSGRSVDNYSSFLLDPALNYQQHQQTFPLELPSSNGFPLNPASYTYASSLLQTLFDTDNSQPQPLDNQTMNYSSNNNYQIMNSDGFLPKTSPVASRLPLNSNSAPPWNATASALSSIRSTLLPSAQPQFLPSSLNNKRPNNPSAKLQNEEGKDSAKKACNEPAYKRQRIETPSPLPTFKVRKEKLGDRITALQQLVSPFGKTDTASVLHEAIDYIKFLHDQVNALSTPYLKYGSPPLQRQQIADKPKDHEGNMRDLKSRGLCLVPISSTFPVAAETPSDFWTPTFGVNLK